MIKMFILQLENDDYTFGKLIEKYLYNYKSEWFKFIAFKKEHPHDKHGPGSVGLERNARRRQIKTGCVRCV